jgi:hypothetical protein
MTVQEICNYFKTVVYKAHPNYKVEPTVIADTLNFYLTVRLENDYCYCFLVLPDNTDKLFSEIKPNDKQLKEFMNTEIFPNCVFKKVIIIKKKEEGLFEHRTFVPEHFDNV